MPSKTDTNTDQNPATPGRKTTRPSVDLTGDNAASVPELPNDRDETVGMTGGVPSDTVQQASRDIARGLEDTSRSVESNDAYKKLKAKD